MSSSTDGDATITTSSATDKPTTDEDVDSSPFLEGDSVLAYHGPCLYDAKVQKAEFYMNDWRYYVHYPGWNKTWDEWLGIDCILKRTEKNLQKQKELKEKYASEKNPKSVRLSQEKNKSSIGARGRKRKPETAEKESVNIPIPPTLKKQLVDDFECITQLGQLVKLPRSPSVYEILNKYFDYRVKKDGEIMANVAEIVNGLRTYFDKALPAILLYNNERQQYREAIADNVSPSGVYGAEHLLRLFVKLPELLSSMDIEMETLKELQQKLVDFLRFLQINQIEFFLSNYQTSEDCETDIPRDDDD